MKNTLNYKGFIGSVSYCDEDQVLFGKIEGIYDLVTYESESVSNLIKQFKISVEEYIETCKKFNKPLLKSFKGSFNVRVKPEVHQRAALLATMKGISLNQLVQKAIEKELEAA
ncbi:MAG: type II toxin-antitoxin system HicB family antitoxin [Chitinophagaceae bacterium]|nr:MAG: type II toxin-antitoxin system HicB family antitoxin [Chitinophagaceae bacterium]